MLPRSWMPGLTFRMRMHSSRQRRRDGSRDCCRTRRPWRCWPMSSLREADGRRAGCRRSRWPAARWPGEHNDEHAAAQESDGPPASDQLLDAAGRLCALQLISGRSGYTLRGQPDEEHPALDQCDYDRQALRLALSTKLFKGASSNRFSPVHRHIAEFLGARHLAGVVKGGAPCAPDHLLADG